LDLAVGAGVALGEAGEVLGGIRVDQVAAVAPSEELAGDGQPLSDGVVGQPSLGDPGDQMPFGDLGQVVSSDVAAERSKLSLERLRCVRVAVAGEVLVENGPLRRPRRSSPRRIP
jgi:hypothetical protein